MAIERKITMKNDDHQGFYALKYRDFMGYEWNISAN